MTEAGHVMTAPRPDLDPISIGRVALTVRDLARVADYYQRTVGLSLLAGDSASATLGAGDRPLLELRRDPAARIRSPREAGLFHTAFLLPARADLGRWARHAIERQIPIQGLSDHIVSEAIYLSDPEGNGIEIYADRPRESWRWTEGEVAMATDALDLAALLSASPGKWTGAPEGSLVGHVHLQVGDVRTAEVFFGGRIGFDVTAHYPGAAFFATGGYHHHLAANVWNSHGAGLRELPSTGLSEVELRLRDPEHLARLGANGMEIADPWGTPIRLGPALSLSTDVPELRPSPMSG